MPKKRSAQVVNAMLIGDSAELSRLSKLGAAKRKEKREKKKIREEKKMARDHQRKTEWHLKSAMFKARQANEHICPVD